MGACEYDDDDNNLDDNDRPNQSIIHYTIIH